MSKELPRTVPLIASRKSVPVDQLSPDKPDLSRSSVPNTSPGGPLKNPDSAAASVKRVPPDLLTKQEANARFHASLMSGDGRPDLISVDSHGIVGRDLASARSAGALRSFKSPSTDSQTSVLSAPQKSRSLRFSPRRAITDVFRRRSNSKSRKFTRSKSRSAKNKVIKLDSKTRRRLVNQRKNRRIRDRAVRHLTLVRRPFRKKTADFGGETFYARCCSRVERLRTTKNRRFICQIAMVIMMFFLVDLHASQHQYHRRMVNFFNEYFGATGTDPVVSTTQVETEIHFVASRLWELNKTIDYLTYPEDVGNRLVLTFDYGNGSSETWTTNETNPGPFGWPLDDLDIYCEEANAATLQFSLQSFMLSDNGRSCRLWEFNYFIEPIFGKPDLGTTLFIDESKCANYDSSDLLGDKPLDELAVISILLFMLSVVALLFSIHRIYRAFREYRDSASDTAFVKTDRGKAVRLPPWQRDWLWKRFASISKWNVAVNRVEIVAYSAVSYMDAINFVDGSDFLSALECVVVLHSCLILLLSTDSVGGDYTAFMDTMRRAFGPVARFFIGMLIVFMGFVHLGICVWGTPGKIFEDVDQTMCTLFAVMGGDSVLDTFQKLGMDIFSILYMLIFSVLFINIIFNIILAQMELSFFEACPSIDGEHNEEAEHHGKSNSFVQGWSTLRTKEERESKNRSYGSCQPTDLLQGSKRNLMAGPDSIQHTPVMFWKKGSGKRRDPMDTSSVKTGRQQRKKVGHQLISSFLLGRIKMVRHHSLQVTYQNLRDVQKTDTALLENGRGGVLVNKIALHYRSRLRSALGRIAQMLDVDLDQFRRDPPADGSPRSTTGTLLDPLPVGSARSLLSPRKHGSADEPPKKSNEAAAPLGIQGLLAMSKFHSADDVMASSRVDGSVLPDLTDDSGSELMGEAEPVRRAAAEASTGRRSEARSRTPIREIRRTPVSGT